LIISRKRLAKAKVEKLKHGYSAYAETQEVATLIEKELNGMDLSVRVDRTPIGSWFFPEASDGHPASDCPPGTADSHCS